MSQNEEQVAGTLHEEEAQELLLEPAAEGMPSSETVVTVQANILRRTHMDEQDGFIFEADGIQHFIAYAEIVQADQDLIEGKQDVLLVVPLVIAERQGWYEPEQETEEDQDEASEEEEAPVAFVCTWKSMGFETIEITQSLDDDSRREQADKMAVAIERKNDLEKELSDISKTYRNRIKVAESEAAEAAEAYRDGTKTEEIHCEIIHDYGSLEVQWWDTDRDIIVKRREMKPAERQLPLMPSPAPEKKATVTPFPETVGKPEHQKHTCLDCAHMTSTEGVTPEGGGDMPEPCQECSQANNGDMDNWSPARKCYLCAHAAANVKMPPCKGCSRNPTENLAGDEDRWVWKDEAAEAPEEEEAELPAVEHHCGNCAETENWHEDIRLDNGAIVARCQCCGDTSPIGQDCANAHCTESEMPPMPDICIACCHGLDQGEGTDNWQSKEEQPIPILYTYSDEIPF